MDNIQPKSNNKDNYKYQEGESSGVNEGSGNQVVSQDTSSSPKRRLFSECDGEEKPLEQRKITSVQRQQKTKEELYQEGLSNIIAGRKEEGYKQLIESAENLNHRALELLHKESLVSNGGVTQEKVKSVVEQVETNSSDGADELFFIGFCYLNGYGVNQDYEQGVICLGKAAELKQAGALYELGMLYLEGRYNVVEGGYDVEQNIEKGFGYLCQAGVLKQADAIYELGIISLEGKYGVKKDINAGLGCLGRAAELKHEDAPYELGMIYLKGRYGVKENIITGIKYLRQAAELKHEDGLYELGMIYLEGKYGVDKNSDEGIKYLRQAAEFEYEDAAQALIQYLEQAGEKKDAKAFYELGMIYLAGKYGIVQDTDDGVYYIKQAAALEGENEDAMLIKYLEQAGELENGYALYELGMIYLEGKYGVRQHIEKGIKYLEQAGELENEHALYELGMISLEGKYGVEKNISTGVEYLVNSFNSGGVVTIEDDEIACYFLGKSLLEGAKGNQEEIDLGVRFLEIAVKLGELRAQFLLGIYYLEGVHGIEQDIPEGLECLGNAIDGNNAQVLKEFNIKYVLGDSSIGEEEEIEKSLLSLEEKANKQKDLFALSFLGILYLTEQYGEGKKPEGLKYLYELIGVIGKEAFSSLMDGMPDYWSVICRTIDDLENLKEGEVYLTYEGWLSQFGYTTEGLDKIEEEISDEKIRQVANFTVGMTGFSSDQMQDSKLLYSYLLLERYNELKEKKINQKELHSILEDLYPSMDDEDFDYEKELEELKKQQELMIKEKREEAKLKLQAEKKESGRSSEN